jgi:hypothetical protein
MSERDELQQELTTLESDLEVARRQLESLREQREDPDALPDTSDDAVLIREFEDQREIVAELEARERTLREQLG